MMNVKTVVAAVVFALVIAWVLEAERMSSVISYTLVEELVVPVKDTVAVNEPVQVCWFGRFKDGRVGMRARDSVVCGPTYRARYTTTQRSLSPKQQRIIDAQIIRWSAALDIQS